MSISREDLMNAVEQAGFKKVYANGERVNYKRGDYSIRFDPPDKGSATYHLHVETGSGYYKVSYDAELTPVKKSSDAAHMKTQGP